MNYDSHIKAYNRNNLKEKLKMFDPTSLISLPFDLINLGLSHKQAKKNFEEQKRQYEQNMKFQREQFDYTKQLNEKNFNYQKDLNNLMMQREDNAVQRRYTDLKNAGLNPLMADGQSASSAGMSTAGGSSSSHSGTEAAQIDFRELAPVFISAMLDSKRIKNEKAMTEIERERLNNQLLNDHENRLYTIAKRITEEKEPAVKNALIDQYNATVRLINKQAEALGINIRIARGWGQPVGKNIGKEEVTVSPITKTVYENETAKEKPKEEAKSPSWDKNRFTHEELIKLAQEWKGGYLSFRNHVLHKLPKDPSLGYMDANGNIRYKRIKEIWRLRK